MVNFSFGHFLHISFAQSHLFYLAISFAQSHLFCSNSSQHLCDPINSFILFLVIHEMFKCLKASNILYLSHVHVVFHSSIVYPRDIPFIYFVSTWYSIHLSHVLHDIPLIYCMSTWYLIHLPRVYRMSTWYFIHLLYICAWYSTDLLYVDVISHSPTVYLRDLPPIYCISTWYSIKTYLKEAKFLHYLRNVTQKICKFLFENALN